MSVPQPTKTFLGVKIEQRHQAPTNNDAQKNKLASLATSPKATDREPTEPPPNLSSIHSLTHTYIKTQWERKEERSYVQRNELMKQPKNF